ncbi:MAG: hypothetical protein GWO26_30050 [Phycisphaerae bacterium]|nr:hypothetical protein [Phycisphaerae bacterium]
MEWFNREEEDRDRWEVAGDYNGEKCPKCGRERVLLCNDKKRRCEKCRWCIEDEIYDGRMPKG